MCELSNVSPYVNRVKFDVLIPATAANANSDAAVRRIAMLTYFYNHSNITSIKITIQKI
ncbi:MAG: hypothetical protein PWP67_2435 [Clostridium butyricum]|uniref:hypothetical protein n=1 Tax=Thermoanaerobacterium thermosaccharolyticum TaxID=1517 RepID=UPI0029EB2B72|nr:hypothetical protein [Clostridium butyricum]